MLSLEKRSRKLQVQDHISSKFFCTILLNLHFSSY